VDSRYDRGTSGGQVIGVDEARAKIIIKDWTANGVLVRTEYYDPQRRRSSPGLKVDIDRIPGTVEGSIF